MGRAVVHFEIEGLDGARLREFYRELFGWDAQVDPGNPSEYALIERAQNLDGAGNGLGGAIAQVPDVPSTTWRDGPAPRATLGESPSSWQFQTLRPRSSAPKSSVASGCSARIRSTREWRWAASQIPKATSSG